jgi:hypothetical protein
MVTMGDSMSLLLCFFVMMLNFGSLRSDELINIFGVLSGGKVIVPIMRTGQEMARQRMLGEDENSPIVLRQAGIPRHLADLRRRLAAEGYANNVSLADLKYGLRIRFADELLFHEDGTISADGRNLLADVVNIFQGSPNEIRLTASIAQNGASAETAYTKALAVAEFLVAEGRVSRARISCGAHGTEFGQPLVFDLMLMEKADTKQLSFEDLWEDGEWRR